MRAHSRKAQWKRHLPSANSLDATQMLLQKGTKRYVPNFGNSGHESNTLWCPEAASSVRATPRWIAHCNRLDSNGSEGRMANATQDHALRKHGQTHECLNLSSSFSEFVVHLGNKPSTSEGPLPMSSTLCTPDSCCSAYLPSSSFNNEHGKPAEVVA